MELKSITAEFITKAMDNISFPGVGDIFEAEILKAEDKDLLLLLADSRTIRARILADLDLKAGQIVKLQVKEIAGTRIELTLFAEEDRAFEPRLGLGEKYGIWPYTGDKAIIHEMVQRGLPVTSENAETVQRTLKHIHFILHRAAPPLDSSIPAPLDAIDMPIDELAKWFFDGFKGKAYGDVTECEKFSMLLGDLTKVDVKDIINLVKHGFKINLTNLVLVKNLRENKGFPEALLKFLYGKTDDMRISRGKQQNTDPLRDSNEGDDGRKAKMFSRDVSPGDILPRKPTAKGTSFKREIVGDRPPRLKPVNIKNILNKAKEIKGNNPRQWAAKELLLQRAALLEEILRDQNICILHFLLGEEFKSCFIKKDRGKGNNENTKNETLGLEIDTGTLNLGDIKIHVKIEQKNIKCKFFVRDREITKLIEGDVDILEHGLKKLGFNVGPIEFYSNTTKRPWAGDKIIDLKV